MCKLLLYRYIYNKHKNSYVNNLKLNISIVLILSSFFMIAQDFKVVDEIKRKDVKSKREDIFEEPFDESKFEAASVDENLMYNDEKTGFYFVFNNVGVIDKYYDEDALQDIENATTLEGDIELIRKLEKYISHFGIVNFYEDTKLLWKLAQLYEKNGMHERAKAAYLLVLKHHPINNYKQVRDYTQVLHSFNDMTEMEQDIFVPLDYYYKLVDFRSRIDTLRPPKSVLLNMGDLINEKNVPEYGPSISTDDGTIIFTKKIIDARTPGLRREFNENLYFAVNQGGYWGESQEFPIPIKSNCNEGSAVLSKDGSFLVFSRCIVDGCDTECSDCLGSCDLFYSRFDKKKERWSTPENFGKEINSKGWDSHPSFSITEDTIYFASNRPGGFGMSDIYYIVKTGKDRWSKAINMGPVVNSRGNEWSPFHSKKHKVFYFSSNGHIVNFDDSRVSNDLYRSNFNDGRWLEPKNLGPLVNGEGDETYFSIDVNNKRLYYAKTEEGAANKEITDLYSFPVPMEAQPLATTVLKGRLVDEETGKPYDGIVSVIDLENGIEVAPKFMRPDGSYEFDLIDHNKYLLVIQGDDFFRIEELFVLDGDTSIETTAKSVQEKKLQFSSIKFENGKAKILAEMEPDLNNIVNFMVDNPMFNLSIGGHTDSDGNPESNRRLSQNRADAIKDYLIDRGFIDRDRIEAIGYGDKNPIRHPEITEEDKHINRRVEFKITKAGEQSSEFDD